MDNTGWRSDRYRWRGPIPPMMIDVVFSSALELGRLGTRSDIHPLRVELSRGIASRKVYESYYVRILLRLSGPL